MMTRLRFRFGPMMSGIGCRRCCLYVVGTLRKIVIREDKKRHHAEKQNDRRNERLIDQPLLSDQMHEERNDKGTFYRSDDQGHDHTEEDIDVHKTDQNRYDRKNQKRAENLVVNRGAVM